MRYDTEIFFQKFPPAEYNQVSGNYEDGKPEEVKKHASVNSSGIESLKIYFGEIKEGSLVVQLQNHYKEPFDYIRIGDKQYSVEGQQPLRVKHVFLVTEKV